MADEIRKNLRIGAYGVVVDEERILLARFIGGARPVWILPGGGVEHGEDPADGVLRELTEETGFTGKVTGLLGVHSLHLPEREWDGEVVDHHGIRIIYAVEITGGVLTHETDNSTDRAEWFPIGRLDTIEHGDIVNVGLRMWQDR